MPPEAARPASLRDAQRAMARVLRSPDGAPVAEGWFDGPETITVADRLAVYRNNSRQFFRTALALTYPVLQRRVGDDFFRQLATEYRDEHPSRSGDLHWVGAQFPDWLRKRLGDTGYAWLVDLARLEWACEEAAAAALETPLGLEALAAQPPESLDGTRLRLQPSLCLVASDWPIWTLWQANQVDDAGPVDLTTGPEHCICAGTAETGIVVYRVDAETYALLARLRDGMSFADAVSGAGTTPDALARLLGWAFAECLVVGVSPSAPA
jgi:hypothetical protein